MLDYPGRFGGGLLDQPVDRGQQRRLAGTVGADGRHDRARLYHQRHVADDLAVAIHLAKFSRAVRP